MHNQPSLKPMIACLLLCTVGIWLGIKLADSGIHPEVKVYEDYSATINGVSIPSVKGY